MLAGNAFCSLFNKGNFIANSWCFCNVYIYIKHCKICPRVFWSHPLYEECLTKFIQNLSICCNSRFSFSPAQICTTGAISILVSSSHIAIVWINEWCIYIVLYCVLLYTQSALLSCGGGSLLNPHQCAASTWMMRRLPQDNSASALATHQLQVERRERVIEPIKCMCSPHSSYRWRGERVIEPIKCMSSPHTSYRWRGERVIEPIKCMSSPHTSYRWRGERVIEPIKCMLSPHTSYRWRGERVIEPIKCMLSPHTSYRWRGERVIEPIKCMRSPHTSYRWRGERVIEPIKCMRSPHTSYRWRGERVIEQSSVCAHHTPATGGEERES